MFGSYLLEGRRGAAGYSWDLSGYVGIAAKGLSTAEAVAYLNFVCFAF